MNIILLVIGLLTISPQRVEVTASDAWTLVGDYYAAEAESAPAALIFDWELADQNWSGLVPALHEAGYAVLVISLRGYGETLGAKNWPQAEQDTQTWIAWLGDQHGIDPARISLIGASVGANMALRGMANDERIVTAVALSPGRNMGGVTTEDAMVEIGARPVFLAASFSDSYCAHTVRLLTALAAGDTVSRFYVRSGHGTEMLVQEAELAGLIVDWLGRGNS